MNAADENRKMNNPVKTNGVVEDPRPCCSGITLNSHENDEKVEPQEKEKLKGNLAPNSDCNKHHITNGAYPKVVTTSYSAVSIYENGESSNVAKCTTQFVSGKSNNMQIEVSYDSNNKSKDCLQNNVECQGNVSCSGIVQKLPNYVNNEVAFDYDRNSSSEDEECCIYTYKGDSNQMADLPSSFFRLDLMPSKPNGTSRNSSPDMDYLEMDFDPGPSNDRYSSSDSECGEERFVAEEPPSLPVDCEFIGMEPDPTPPSPLSTPSPVRSEQPGSSGQYSQNTKLTCHSFPMVN